MKVHFYKYQATGNDFVLIDNREGELSLSREQVSAICDRRLGVGADGVMLVERHPDVDFNLVYYNRDGSQSLCGNGSRAAVRFASSLGMVNGKALFHAFDGKHAAELTSGGTVRLKMSDVQEIKSVHGGCFLDTGSPHYVRFVEDVHNYPVFEEGKKIRQHPNYSPGGTNANFVQLLTGNTIFVRTYERGVEDETLSCGTGVVASALAVSRLGYSSPVNIRTRGGDLQVEFKTAGPGNTTGSQAIFTDIYLSGPAKMVFDGYLEL